MTIVPSEGSPDLITAEIIDNADSNIVIKTIPLHKKGSNLYLTDPFIPPNEVFKIGVSKFICTIEFLCGASAQSQVAFLLLSNTRSLLFVF